jgi:hypothetical protein
MELQPTFNRHSLWSIDAVTTIYNEDVTAESMIYIYSEDGLLSTTLATIEWGYKQLISWFVVSNMIYFAYCLGNQVRTTN